MIEYQALKFERLSLPLVKVHGARPGANLVVIGLQHPTTNLSPQQSGPPAASRASRLCGSAQMGGAGGGTRRSGRRYPFAEKL